MSNYSLKRNKNKKCRNVLFLKFVITVNSFFKTLHQNLTISCFNLYSVDNVHYISSGFLQKYLSVIVLNFQHLIYFPLQQTSPMWHLCRRKQTTPSNIPLAQFPLLQIYLHVQTFLYNEQIFHICLSIQPYLHRNVHTHTHTQKQSFSYTALQYSRSNHTHTTHT